MEELSPEGHFILGPCSSESEMLIANTLFNIPLVNTEKIRFPRSFMADVLIVFKAISIRFM
mgnify:CR=1 FL=1